MELSASLDLNTILTSPNLAEHLSEEDLHLIGHQAFFGWQADKDSRADWEQKTKRSMDLALQVAETKTFPWQGASNVKFPIVTIAAMQYQARAYPTLIPAPSIVKCRTIGDDPDGLKAARAFRVSDHMSFQILEEDEGWEEHMDRALLHQAIVGCAFKKTYFDPSCGHNVSEHVLAKDLYVSYYSPSLEKAPRITQVLYFTENDLYERYHRGIFLDWNKDGKPQDTPDNLLTEAKDRSQGLIKPPHDEVTPYEILEQHCFIDLDGDGYREPYVVYLRKDTNMVLRIVARFQRSAVEYSKKDKNVIVHITPDQYYTKFPFIPSPDGGFYDLGFGTLLGPLNESINTSINQLIDAGTLSNTAGGFLGRGVKFRSGDNSFRPFEWKRVDSTGDDLRKGVFPLPVREPSSVLFNLLSLLVDYGERIGMAVDSQVGKTPGQNTPAETSRNAVQEGQRVFNAIFKRTHRSLKEEFRKWYKLNAVYLDEQVEYYSITSGDSKKVLLQDYWETPKDIIPASDPNMISDETRMQQAQLLKQAAMSTQGYDKYEVEKRFLQAIKVADIEKVFPDPKGKNAVPPQPHPKVIIAQMANQVKELDIKLKNKLAQAKLYQEFELSKAKIKELEAKAAKELAEAKGIATGHEIAALQVAISAAKNQQDGILKAMDILSSIDKEMSSGQGQQGGMGAMANPAGNNPDVSVPKESSGAGQGGMG
jgi:chaperonin GroES